MNRPFDRDEILIRALRILQEELTVTDKIVSAHGRDEHGNRSVPQRAGD